MTISDVFAAAAVTAAKNGTTEAVGDRPRVLARKRARNVNGVYRSLWVSRKIGDVSKVAVADLRSAWWTPASLPTLRQTWEQRMPDRTRVPGEHAVLYGGWVAYNHTIGLVVPAVALVVVGVLTALVWAARHPARFVLAAVLAAPLIVLIYG